MQEKAEEFKKTGGKLYHELAVDDSTASDLIKGFLTTSPRK
jgi:hypothetical protein